MIYLSLHYSDNDVEQKFFICDWYMLPDIIFNIDPVINIFNEVSLEAIYNVQF